MSASAEPDQCDSPIAVSRSACSSSSKLLAVAYDGTAIKRPRASLEMTPIRRTEMVPLATSSSKIVNIIAKAACPRASSTALAFLLMLDFSMRFFGRCVGRLFKSVLPTPLVAQPYVTGVK
jgi:hypothetical protein